jgi:hypothetical protein
MFLEDFALAHVSVPGDAIRLPSGHYTAEESPAELLTAFKEFF